MAKLLRIDLLKKLSIFFLCLLLKSILSAEQKEKAIELSLDEFASLAIQRGLNAKILAANLQSSKYSYLVIRREIFAPQLGLAGQIARSNSLQTLTQSQSDSFSGQLQITQPFIWGGNLLLSGDAQSLRQITNTLSMNQIVSTQRTFSRSFPQWTVSYKQPLYLLKRNSRIRNLKKNHFSYEIAKKNYDRELQSIELEARFIYYETQIGLERVEVERKKSKSSKTLYEVTQTLVEAGRLSRVEEISAQISFKLDQRRIQNALTSSQQSMNSLKNSILLPLEQEVRLTSTLRYFPVSISLEALQNAALKYRSDLMAAQHNLELSEINIQETKETTRPSLESGAFYKLDTLTTGERPEDWGVSANLNWPFFDSGITSLRVRERQNAFQNAKRQYELLKRQISVEIQNAYLEFMRVEEQISDFSSIRKQAENNLSAVSVRYEQGSDRRLDVFDAENKLREIDLEYFNLLLNFNKAYDRLSFLVGKKIDDLVE